MTNRAPQPHTFKLFGVEFPITKWGITALTVVAVVGVTAFVYQKLYDDPERALLTLKEVNARIAADIEEFGLHAMEEPTKHELFEDTDGALLLRVYPDHCVLIQRRLRNGSVLTKLVPDLARRDQRVSTQIAPPLHGPALLPILHAQPNCQRGCLNPHPGQFQWWYGAQRGEWVEVWRRWPEGCTHTQMFNPRSGTWDSNPDGSPRVRWTCCMH